MNRKARSCHSEGGPALADRPKNPSARTGTNARPTFATCDSGPCDREPLPRDSQLSTRRRTFPPASNFQLRFRSRRTPSGHRSPKTGPPASATVGHRIAGGRSRVTAVSPVTGHQSAITGHVLTAKSFRIRSYEKMRLQVLCNAHLQIIGLKVPWNEQLQKTPGGRGTSEVKNIGEFSEELVAQVARQRGRTALLL